MIKPIEDLINEDIKYRTKLAVEKSNRIAGEENPRLNGDNKRSGAVLMNFRLELIREMEDKRWKEKYEFRSPELKIKAIVQGFEIKRDKKIPKFGRR